jgi:cell wall-associated NlpC family hydrolase
MIIQFFRRNLKPYSIVSLTTVLVVHPLTASAFTHQKNIIQDYSSGTYDVDYVNEDIQQFIVIGEGEAYDESRGVQRDKYDVNSPEHVRQYSWEETEPGDVIATARKLIGKPYIFAAAHPRSGFDCSGLVKFVYGSTKKIYLPHSASQQTVLGERISAEEAEPGDLIAYGSGSNYGHIGIYSGDDKMIHSARSQGGVRETSINRIAGPKVYIRVIKAPEE